MRRNIAKFFSHFQGVNLLTLDDFAVQSSELEYSPLQQIIKEIFTVDPVSGLPKGDIQYWLSKDGNPQVKAWIESNLLQPRVANGMQDPEKVSDDLIVEMSRQADETTESYASRLMSIYDEAQKNLDSLRAQQVPKSD